MRHLLMDHTGHTTIDFDQADPQALADANKRFLELVGGQKHSAFTRKAGAGDYTQIRRPDQQRDETLFVPQLRGG